MDVNTITIDRQMFRAVRSFNRDRFRYLDAAAEAGPLTRLRFGPVNAWVVTDADLAREMLIAHGADWERPQVAVVPIRLGIGENLFTQSDDDWALVAPSVAPAFRRRALEERLESMKPIIESGVAKIGHGRFIDVELHMGVIALQLAAWVLFGEELAFERAVEIATAQRNVVNWVGARLSKIRASLPIATGSSARKMRVNRAVLDNYADEILANARLRPEPRDDTVGLLLGVQPGGKALDAKAMREQVLGLLMAGNETTAAALTWACVNGAENPAEWARLRTDPARSRAFIDETLRLTPAVWGFARQPKRKGVMLGEQRIGRREVVTIYLRGINRSPQSWNNPLVFSPERHEEQHGNASLIPFGLGPRGCIGQHLAMAEMIATLPVLAAHGDVMIDGPVESDPSFALRIRGGLRAKWVG
jgi:enediyne biosynthesis protein E7